MNRNLGRLGGQLGIGLCLVGFLAIFLGWNGAASKNVPMAQFPFLISGGIAGLAVVVVGAAMLIVQNAREDRARLEAVLERLATAAEHRGGMAAGTGVPGLAGLGAAAPVADNGMGNGMGGMGGGVMVLAGPGSYHRLDCALPVARDEAHLSSLGDVLVRGLEPCRVCRPPALAPQPS